MVRVESKGDSAMRKFKLQMPGFLSAVFVMFIIAVCGGCAEVREIPGQVQQDLPNPVSDFTEKDKFIQGLNWYRQANFDIAKKFWKPLAESGDCDAEYAMGLLYYSGAGVRRSYDNALAQWTRAAEQGQAQAQVALGAAYSRLYIPYISINCKRGCGLDKNLVEAYKWFGIAIEDGTPREVRASEKSISRISLDMTPEQINEAQSEIEAFKPKPSRCKSRDLLIAAPTAARAFY